MILCWACPQGSLTWSLCTTLQRNPLRAVREMSTDVICICYCQGGHEVRRDKIRWEIIRIIEGFVFCAQNNCLHSLQLSTARERLCLVSSSRRSECGGGGTPCRPWRASPCCCPLPSSPLTDLLPHESHSVSQIPGDSFDIKMYFNHTFLEIRRAKIRLYLFDFRRSLQKRI